MDKVNGKATNGDLTGKANIDVAATRARPHMYTTPGTYAYADLGRRPIEVEDPTLAKVMSDLNQAQARIRSLNFLEERARVAVKRTTGGGENLFFAGAEGLEGNNAAEERGKERSPLARSRKKYDPNRPKRPPKRIRLPLVKMPDLANFLSLPENSGKLVVVCCLGSWAISCRQAEHMLEQANFDLQNGLAHVESAAAVSYNNQKQKKKSALKLQGHFLLAKVDMGEGPLLADRFNIRSVPSYLMFYGGALVFASTAFHGGGSSKVDFFSQLETSWKDAFEGHHLPTGFKFSGIDTAALDSIPLRLQEVFPRGP